MSSSTRPKLSVAAAWTAWEADANAGAEFLHCVVPWTEGTAAQLLRDQWRVGVRRPTASEVQERLRHHLGVVAAAGAPSYIDALEQARAMALDEISKARLPASAKRTSRRS